ncbi:hypothetical protein Q5M60_04815 [Acinetobacter baumannii]|nr:hypothetical protein [Acinetobacter baumannii]
MRAEQFIKDHGLERAREVVEGAPRAKSFISGDVKEAQGYNSNLSKYVMWDWVYKFHWNENDWQIHSYTWSEFIIDVFNLSDLKRLVESVDRVNQRGYSKTKDHLDYLISYSSEFGHVSKEEVNELTADLKNYESIYGEGNE